MHIKSSRQLYGRLCYVDELCSIKACMLRLRSPLRELHTLPLVGQTATASIIRIGCVSKIRHSFETLLEFLLEVCLNLVSQLLALCRTYHPLGDELILVLLRGSRHLTNLVVHNRLGEAWFVNFVVAIITISNHVKHDVLAVLGPVLNGESTRPDHSLSI